MEIAGRMILDRTLEAEQPRITLSHVEDLET